MLPQLTPRIIAAGNPVNWEAPLNRGLLTWHRAIPGRIGGRVYHDLCGVAPGTITASSYANGFGWSGQKQAGLASINTGADSRYVNLGRVRAHEITGDISCFCWLKTATIGGPAEIVAAINTSGFTGWSLENNGGMIALWDGASFKTASTYINDDVWHYVGFAVRSTNVDLYVDGRLVSTQGTSNPRSGTANGSDVNIGGWAAHSRYNTGFIDDVRVYNRGLSEDEARSLYVATCTGYARELQYLHRPLLLQASATSGSPWNYYAQIG